jgi:hypothetical protein
MAIITLHHVDLNHTLLKSDLIKFDIMDVHETSVDHFEFGHVD